MSIHKNKGSINIYFLLYSLFFHIYLCWELKIWDYINRLGNIIYSCCLVHSLKVESEVHFQRPVDLKGGRRIEIGARTYFNSHLVLNAWEEHNGLFYAPTIKIGSGCSFGQYNHISCVNGISIGDNVLTGRWVTICDNNHGETTQSSLILPPLSRPLSSKGPIVIGNNVWLGDKVTVLAGVHIGNNAIIGSNSVVTKDVPDNCVATGIPAKVIKVVS